MKSALYEGSIRHRRRSPVDHSFEYRIFMIYLDLDELDRVFSGTPLWSASKFTLAQFRRRDHGLRTEVPLDQEIRDHLLEETGRSPEGPIRLLTHLRYFGYCFNPVSFYYCFDRQESLETIVAEVDNTPWGERFLYTLDEKDNLGDREKKRYQFSKQFHVSPFMGMDIEYDWRFTMPEKTLSVHMENWKEGHAFFDATLTLRRETITPAQLNRYLLRYPFQTGKTLAAIYWNALLLWMKKAPFFTHPGKIDAKVESR